MKKFFVWGLILMLSLMVVGCDPNSNGGGTTGNGNNGGLTYIVTFNAMGAVGTPPEAVTVTTGSTITLHDGSGFSRDGYLLDGWYTNIAGTTTNYDVSSYYTVTGNVTFYAKWVLARTVTFNLNGGNGTISEPLTVGTGTDITLPSDGFSRDGFTFGGWTTNLSGNTKYYGGSSFTVTGNVTMNAIWYFSGNYRHTESALGLTVVTAIAFSTNGDLTYTETWNGTVYSTYQRPYYIVDNIIYGTLSGLIFVNSNTLMWNDWTFTRQ